MRWKAGALCIALAGACRGGDLPPEADRPPADLSVLEHASRVSLAIRGTRPDRDELAQVAAEPAALSALVDDWLQHPDFGLTIEDMWAEILQLRTDTATQLPPLGTLEGHTTGELYHSESEAPLRLVAHIVTHDRPFTDIVTADTMRTDAVLSMMYGLDFDPARADEEPWQDSRWSDGRPLAGLLSDAHLYRRWESAGSNFHRQRANLVADTFLCEDFASRDIVVPGGIDIADEAVVAEAVRYDPACVACHQALDGLAATFWGYKPVLHRGKVTKSHREGCGWDWSDGQVPTHGTSFMPRDHCYPLVQFDPADEMGWQEWGLRAPAYYGDPVDDLAHVGQRIASDPRFATCMTRRFAGYLLQTEPAAVPLDDVLAWREAFVDTGFDAKELVRAIVLSPTFATLSPPAGVPGFKVLRPEQLDRTVAALTGYRWVAQTDTPTCSSPALNSDVITFGNQCWGDVPMLGSDLFGFRAMAGGIDGVSIGRPTHASTPARTLVVARLAADAAHHALSTGHMLADRPTGPRKVRIALAELNLLLYGELLTLQDPAVDDGLALFEAALAHSGDPERAWTVTLTAMLQDPRMVLF